MEKNNFGWILLVILVLMGFFFFKAQKQSTFCTQVITPACNPVTNIIQDFPTPCDVPVGWTNDLTQCHENTPITREIIVLLDNVNVKISISGAGKFGGIIKEKIPLGLVVSGITSTNLGIQGSATGKLTGSIYEIAFVVDNVNNPYIIYTVSKPMEGTPYDFSGDFEFAQGFGGCVPKEEFKDQQSVIDDCNIPATKAECESGGYGEFCNWNLLQGIIGGDKQIFKCIKKCLRPSNLCADANSIPDECGGICTGFWTILKRTDADKNCNNYVENIELLGSINDWVGEKPPFNDNQILLQVISGWVKSTGCTQDAQGVYSCGG